MPCRRIALAGLLACAVVARTAQAQDASAVAGEYCLAGVREVGSCIRLSAGGKFEYFLAYGAYDENAEGTWQLDRGDVVVDTPPYDKRPGFAFKRLDPGDAIEVVVERNGQRLNLINVRARCGGRTVAGITGTSSHPLRCPSAPTSLELGIDLYSVPLQRVDIPRAAGTGKVYVFDFDPGDLGRRRFSAERLKIETEGRLRMIYRHQRIRELDGRPFVYVRP